MPAIDLTPRTTHPWVSDGHGRVRFGVSIFPQPPDWSEFIDVVQRMEAAGIDSYLSYDHPRANVDCWTALSALAATTKTIRLGTIVACIYYRSPYMLARQAADVDRLSNGRLILGIGIGHVVDEFAEMGIPMPAVGLRQRGLDETVEIVRGLWSGEPFEHHGEQWNATSTGSFLPPVQQPHVPILIAGGGEQVTLRQVAQYADASNMGGHKSIGMAVTIEDVTRKFDKLREYCEQFGRPYDAILRSQFTMPLIMAETKSELEQKLERIPKALRDAWGPAMFAGTPDETIAFYRSLNQAGFEYFIGNILAEDLGTVDLMCKYLLPAFA